MNEAVDTPERLAKRLLDEGQKSCAFFEGLSSGQWDHPVYTEGACWSVHQVLAHFVTAEKALCLLVENILAGGGGSPEGFDLNAYNERKAAELAQTSTSDLIRRFAGLRQETASLVSGLQLEDLARTGRHPFLGLAPLADIIKLIYRHNQIHIREIRGALKENETHEA
jgi:hypothetical protein